MIAAAVVLLIVNGQQQGRLQRMRFDGMDARAVTATAEWRTPLNALHTWRFEADRLVITTDQVFSGGFEHVL